MARPKTSNNKIKVNMSLEEEAIKKGREVAEKAGLSLSALTEQCYKNAHDRLFRILENPVEGFERLQKEMDIMKEQFIKSQLKGEEKKGQS